MSSPPNRPIFIYVVSLLSAIGGFLFGYDTGIVSGAMLLIKADMALNDLWQELIVSMTVAFAWIFSSIAGIFTDTFGRRPVVLVASFLFFVGSVVMAIAMDKWILLAGRAIAGAGIGLASMVVPMYIAEVAPDDVRGSLVTLNNCFITGGQFIAAVLAAFLSYFEHNVAWRLMLGLAGIPALIQFIGFFFMPESPRWLMQKGHEERARKALYSIRQDDLLVAQEFKSIKESCVHDASRSKKHVDSSILTQILGNSNLRRALMVGCSLQIVAQMSGINTVMYYSASIIQMAGVHNETDALWLAAAVASVNFLCTFVGFYLVERTGRRKLTLASLAGVFVSLVVLAIGFQVAELNSPSINIHPANRSDPCAFLTSCSSCVRSDECGFCYTDVAPWSDDLCLPVKPLNSSVLPFDAKRSEFGECVNGTNESKNLVWSYDSCPSKYSWVTVVGLMLYLFFFAPGMGPMPWTINAEIYPLWARGVCFSIATSFNWSCNLLVSLTFLTLVKAVSQHGAFWLYSSFAAVGWLFFFAYLPETRGVSLENVESLFSNRRKSTDQPKIDSAMSIESEQSYGTSRASRK